MAFHAQGWVGERFHVIPCRRASPAGISAAASPVNPQTNNRLPSPLQRLYGGQRCVGLVVMAWRTLPPPSAIAQLSHAETELRQENLGVGMLALCTMASNKHIVDVGEGASQSAS